ncbi:MAG TPA: TetR/AcrR family transcriptional regulator [Steroidobacteraceae bacterium]
MKPIRSDAAERIVREALRLFAERGYERTSVPDIQEAAGLARGSGAMYKHFPSKEAVLRAGIERYIGYAQSAQASVANTPLHPRDALAALARGMLDSLAARRDEMRILWRVVEQFPDLQARARREIMQGTYAAVAAWLREAARKGLLAENDSAAVAAVLIGSLAMFRVFPALWGEQTIEVDDERFLRAWSHFAARGLGLDGGNPASRSD